MSDDNTIAELFARNPLDKPHTDEELDKIIAYMRERRKQALLGAKAPKPKALTKSEAKSTTLDAIAKELDL